MISNLHRLPHSILRTGLLLAYNIMILCPLLDSMILMLCTAQNKSTFEAC